jgi:hypothetical protein
LDKPNPWICRRSSILQLSSECIPPQCCKISEDSSMAFLEGVPVLMKIDSSSALLRDCAPSSKSRSRGLILVGQCRIDGRDG